MKRMVFIAILIFVFLPLQTSFATSNVAFAQESSEDVLPASTVIEYQLPYPGLLPDSPLYFLKVVRDKIVGFLIFDPFKKAEFYLLTADKRLGAGISLVNKRFGKEDLAASTISKGENYFGEAISKVREAKRQGMETKDILRKMSLAAKKHQEVLKELERKVPQNKKEGFKILQKRADDFEKEVNELILR